MPIYDIKCQKCGEISEFLVPSSSDSRTLVCTNCGGQNLEIISTPNLLKTKANARNSTCCGREERCSTPPCSAGGGCHRH